MAGGTSLEQCRASAVGGFGAGDRASRRHQIPAAGHVNPLVPLALRLQALGDEIAWVIGPDMAERLATQGLRAMPVGPPMTTWFERLMARTRGRPGDGIPAETEDPLVRAAPVWRDRRCVDG